MAIKSGFYTKSFETLRSELDKMKKDITSLSGQDQNKVLKSALYNIGRDVSNGLNQKLAQTIPDANTFTRNAFGFSQVNGKAIVIKAKPKQSSYLQFLLVPGRNQRDQKLSEKLGNDSQWVPTRIFAPTGDITQSNLKTWQHIMAVAGGKRRDPNVFVGVPKGGGPNGIYLRKQPSGRDSRQLIPWAYHIDGAAKYKTIWDFKTVASEMINESAGPAVREAVKYRLEKVKMAIKG